MGYTVEQAAEAIGISVSALVAAENGDHSLTLNQLREAAVMYNFPFGYFYLSNPPRAKSYEPVPDFRIEPDYVGANHYRLNLEIKKCRDQRLVYIDLLEELETKNQSFQVLSDIRGTNVGSEIRRRLGVQFSDVRRLSYDDAYSYWKEKIENDGVLVYESQYIPDITGVIGAALYYDNYPIILIKRGANQSERKLFTLLHEYAHLLIGKSAINDSYAQMTNQTDSPEIELEAACNKLAAEILVPSEMVNSTELHALEPMAMMEHLSRSFKVTYSTAAVCLKRMDLINQIDLNQLLEYRRQENLRKRKKKGASPIPREILQRLDLGKPTFNAVLQAYSSGALDVFDASSALNLRVNKIDPLVSGVG